MPEKKRRDTQDADEPAARNRVDLRGRVFSPPVERSLSSGALVVTFRLSLVRDNNAMGAASRSAADWVDCAAWGGRTRRSVSRWEVGDLVEIDGALRRRFFRAAARTTTRVEVEVLGARRVAKVGR